MTMEVKKILWPTDLSENAVKAQPYVTSLTEKYQTEVHVLYVMEDLPYAEVAYHGPAADFDASQIDRIREWEEEHAKERLDEICKEHLKGCPLYVRHVAIGDPAKEILKFVEKEKVDMVVMATRGRKGFFYGSVAEKVVRNSPVPVVTIPVSPEK
jgi:nucleotide-binding universal stress UspA family protein